MVCFSLHSYFIQELAMKAKVDRSTLFGSTARAAVAQLLGVGLCTGVLFLFVALTYSRITLPHYTAKYDQKDTQQAVNLLITVVATLSGILLNHCRRCAFNIRAANTFLHG